MRDGAKHPTLLAPSRLAAVLKFENSIFDLGSQILQMERNLVHQMSTVLTIPAQTVHRPFRSFLLNYHPCSISKPDRVMGSAPWKKKHFALTDLDCLELVVISRVNDVQFHRPTVLIEPFGRLVDMIVSPIVRASEDLVQVKCQRG